MDSQEKVRLCTTLALDKKAEDLIILDVQEHSAFTSYFIICSGTSDRQVQAIASNIEISCKHRGLSPLGIEGYREGKWILLDYDDVVVHIFYKPVREFYDLERLWADAPRISIDSIMQPVRKAPRKKSLTPRKSKILSKTK